MAEALNKFVYGPEDDMSLRQSLMDVANTLGCNTDTEQWKMFINNPSNISALKEAKAKYGIPPKNRQSYHTGLGIFGKWHDFCDWGDLFRFYYYAKLSQDYPALNPDVKQNCTVIKGYLAGLENEKVNVDKEFTIRNDNDRRIRQLEAINEKISDFNSFYATMQCDTWLADQAAQKAAAARAAALAQSEKSNISVYQQTAQQSASSTTKIALYVLGGVGVLIGLMIIFKKKSS